MNEKSTACICGCGNDAPLDQGGVPILPGCVDAIRRTYTAEAGISDASRAAYRHGVAYGRTVGRIGRAVVAALQDVISTDGPEREVAEPFLLGVVTAPQERAA